MIVKEIPDDPSIRSQRKPADHMVQGLDELRSNAGEFRPGLEAYLDLRLAGDLALGFGFRSAGGFVSGDGFGGDSVVVPGDVFFGFGGSGCHGADLISRWLGRHTDDTAIVYVDSAYKRQDSLGCYLLL